MIGGVLSLLLASAASVQAHATFQQLWINGVDQAGSCVRLPLSNSPVTSVTGADIACNVNASPSPGTCTVAAGSTIAPEMHQQPGDRDCATLAIGGAHHGPTIIYLAKVDNAATAVGSSAKWFKIFQSGLITDNPIPGYWGNDAMNDDCGKVPATIPSDIVPGDYLLRAETIALHAAGSSGGAQFYMSCYQLTITGGGSASPATVSFPGAYKATDPGILINIYTTLPSYTVPGPAVYVSSGGSNPPPPPPPTSSTGPTSAKPTTTTTTTTKPGTTTKPTTSAAPTTTSGPPGTVPQYGQCGGTGWTGGTVCIAPFKCTVSNAYYSQCL